MHTYTYTCDFCNAHLCLRDQLHAYMPHMHQSRIDFLTHLLFGRAERYNFIQVLALSHRAQVLI